MVFLVAGIFGIIAYLHIPGLMHQKLWRELLAFSFLLLMGLGISIFLLLGFQFPFISDAIGQGIKAIFRLK